MDVSDPSAMKEFSGEHTELKIAKWSDRFFAWLIDFIIVTIAVQVVVGTVTFPHWAGMNDADDWWSRVGIIHASVESVAFFAYWLYFEYTRGQSPGKVLFHLKTVDLAGRKPIIGMIAIESFGKAFLLPIDLILGWLFTNEKRQRIFNKASDTMVISIKDHPEIPGNVTYKKE